MDSCGQGRHLFSHTQALWAVYLLSTPFYWSFYFTVLPTLLHILPYWPPALLFTPFYSLPHHDLTVYSAWLITLFFNWPPQLILYPTLLSTSRLLSIPPYWPPLLIVHITLLPTLLSTPPSCPSSYLSHQHFLFLSMNYQVDLTKQC